VPAFGISGDVRSRAQQGAERAWRNALARYSAAWRTINALT